MSFLILAIVECAICLAFVSGINTFDLHYRVTKQIENALFGKNNFSTGTYIGETDFGYFSEKVLLNTNRVRYIVDSGTIIKYKD